MKHHSRFDQWRVDLAVTGSQKALSLPTGLAVVCASPKALAARKSATLKRVYYDFEDMLKTNPSGNVPYTPSLPLLHGLQVSIGFGWDRLCFFEGGVVFWVGEVWVGEVQITTIITTGNPGAAAFRRHGQCSGAPPSTSRGH